jgi:hypothetical protein
MAQQKNSLKETKPSKG